MRGQRWVPFAVAGAALVLVAAVPVAWAVLSDDPVPAAVRAEPAPSLSPTVTPSPTPSPTPTPPTPSLTPTPSPTPIPARTSTRPRARVSSSPKAMSADEYEHWYCRKATKTTGATTVTLQYCRWPGPDNDRYVLTTSYTGDRIIYSRKVDLGDGSTYRSPHQPQSCSNDDRPTTLYSGEHLHELAPGRRTVVATVEMVPCGDPYATPSGSGDPDYWDTDHTETIVVSLVMDEIAEP